MIFLNLDLAEITELIDMKGSVEKAMNDAARDLAKMVEMKVKEQARQKLNSRFQMYVDGLKTFEEDGVWIVSLDSKVRWIDDGQSEHNMLDDLLKSPKAKTAKDGSKFLTVPFNHGPGKGKTGAGGPSGAAGQDLVATLKSEMKKRGIAWGKVEKGEDGKPLLGKLHGFDISKGPVKTQHGPGQGHGPIGEVRQGPTGTPFLHGVGVYQTPYKGPKGEDLVRRSVTTFRTASSKHKKQGGRWDHPGNQAMNLLEDGLEWARREWQTKISPEVLEKIISSLD